MDQSVKVRLDKEETGNVKIGRGVRQECCLSAVLFNLHSECLTNEALVGSVIRTVNYSGDLVLQGMTDKLISIGRCYGMAMNVEETTAGRI
jgi:hypothetical protein